MYQTFAKLADSVDRRLSFDELLTSWARVAPKGFIVVAPQKAAWQIAESDASIAYADFPTRSALAELYDEQDAYHDEELKAVDQLLGRPPSEGNNFFYSTFEASYGLSDVHWAEVRLLHEYPQAIALIDKALR